MEIDAAREAGYDVRGYAFYHMQDTEGAVSGGGMYLGYGAVDQGDEPMIRVANEIIDALARHGLKTEWDGSPSTRVHVALDWKRRLP